MVLIGVKNVSDEVTKWGVKFETIAKHHLLINNHNYY